MSFFISTRHAHSVWRSASRYLRTTSCQSVWPNQYPQQSTQVVCNSLKHGFSFVLLCLLKLYLSVFWTVMDGDWWMDMDGLTLMNGYWWMGVDVRTLMLDMDGWTLMDGYGWIDIDIDGWTLMVGYWWMDMDGWTLMNGHWWMNGYGCKNIDAGYGWILIDGYGWMDMDGWTLTLMFGYWWMDTDGWIWMDGY